MNPLGIFKTVTDLVVATGVGAVVGNLIKTTTPIDVKTVQRISIAVGGLVLSSMAGDRAAKYATEQIDATVAQVKELKNSIKKNR